MKKTIFICVGLMALLAACRTDGLCYRHPHGASHHILFDWSEAPCASPEGMRVWFYPLDGDTEGVPRDFPGTEGGTARNLTEGPHHLIACNNDTQSIVFTGCEGHDSHHAATRDADILEPMARYGSPVSSQGLRAEDGERVAAQPDMLWIASARSAEIRDSAATVLTPRQVNCRYRFEFRNVGDTENIIGVSASISGMSAAVLLFSSTHRGDVCTLPLEAEVDREGHRIYGEFLTFGYPPESTAPHRMALYLVMADGRKYKYTEGDCLDVTRQVRGASDPFNVEIAVDGLSLPEPITGGGFTPAFSDWTEESHTIEI